MKVLLLNYTDAGGGAAIAACRLAEGLNKNGIQAVLGVCEKKTEKPFVIEIPKKKRSFAAKVIRKLSAPFRKIKNKIINSRFFKFTTTNRIFHSENSESIIDVNWINQFECDVVHLHWINNNMISIRDIARIRKPIVWTMHDSWPCCGAEHHPNVLENDTRWRDGYTRANKPKTTHGIDICRKVWLQKNKYLFSKKIIFTAPSHWEHDVLKQSKLFGQNDCFVIPNIIPKIEFYPKEKKSARQLLNIPQDKIVLGFGIANDIDNPKNMKGTYYLKEALKQLNNSEKYYLVIFGPNGEKFADSLNIESFCAGYVSNTAILSMLYSVCDVFVNPSLIENLPTTSLEAICCGIPVVSFNVGGSSDIVEHQVTGYLAEPYKADDLVTGIEYCIQNQDELSRNALLKANRDFDEETIIKRYTAVYQSALR